MSLSHLNAVQQEAVTSPAQHLLVLAGAGSGKTGVLVHRIAWWVAQGHSLSSIVAVTFTNKAATEMMHRLSQLLQTDVRDLWIGTFHRLAYRLLRKHWEEAGLTPHFQIMDTDDQLRIVRKILAGLKIDEKLLEPKKAAQFIQKQKEEGVRAERVTVGFYREQALLQEVYRHYEIQCQKASLVDFSELLLRTYELFNKNPDIRAHYNTVWSHVLVDEFQDTNTIQYEGLKLWAGKTAALTAVGDDDQSIYSWRGAKVENLLKFTQDYKDVKVVRLEQNYRSKGNILQAANGLIAHNEGRLGKELWTAQGEGEPIALFGAQTEIEEARFVAQEIQQKIRQGAKPKDFAVLYRSNAQSRIFEQIFNQLQLPYRIYGGLRFFERAEIKDVLAYLRFIANAEDENAFDRIINLPARGVGARTLEIIREQAKTEGISQWQALQQILPTLKSPARLEQFVNFVLTAQGCATKVVFKEFVNWVLLESGLLAYYKQKSQARDDSKYENLQEFLAAIEEMPGASDGQLTLEDFLAQVALDVGDETDKSAQQGVSLMTLHAAKGLEFPIVFMVGLEEGLFPHHRSKEGRFLEEERRLCYVGMTRAQEKLYLSFAQKRSFLGSTTRARPSRFLQELPAALVEPQGLEARLLVRQGHLKSTPTATTAAMGVGYKVRHPKFGEGMVLEEEGQGELARVKVHFMQAGVKWLVLSYAALERI